VDLDFLLLPFKFAFMQKAFTISLIVAIPTALVSCFLVVKGWALMGDAVSHSVLPGVVIAYIFGLPLIIGAFATGMVCAIATGYLSDRCRVKQDSIMGIVFSGMFGLGIILYVSINTNVHLDQILFGNILGVGTDDIISTGVVSIVVVIGLLLKWHDFVLHSFDPTQVQTAGLSNDFIHYTLLAAMTLTVVATLATTGLILAIGLMIAPGAIAFLISKKFSSMLLASVGICIFSMFSGTYASFYLDSAPAPTVILVFTAIFVLVFICVQVKTRWRTRSKLQH